MLSRSPLRRSRSPFGCSACRLYGQVRAYGILGFRDVGFRNLGFRDLELRDLGCRDAGCRDAGLRDLGFRLGQSPTQ